MTETGLHTPAAEALELPVRRLPSPMDACSAPAGPPLWLSPDDANSMASPVLARAGLAGEGIRTYEFMNYYTFDYPPAAPGGLWVDLQMFATEEPGLYELQVGVASPLVEEPAPMNLVFSVDGSGSMDGSPIRAQTPGSARFFWASEAADAAPGPSLRSAPGSGPPPDANRFARIPAALPRVGNSGSPLALVQAAGRTVAGRLQAGDVVSVVSWDHAQDVLLSGHVVEGPDDPELLAAFAGLSARGVTDLRSGLDRAYELASAHFEAGRINRVVLMSDGGANVGVTDEELIASMAGAQDEEGIYLVGLGVGSAATYHDLLMDTVTDEGKGAALFLDSEAEVERMLGARFDEVFGVAARSVELELRLPPGFEIVRFSGEEYRGMRGEVRPQNLGPEDTMVFYQAIRGCPEADPAALRVEATVQWLNAQNFGPRSVSAGATFAELLAAPHPQLTKGRAVYLSAEALKGTVDVEQALEALGAAMEAAPEDAELVELAAMLR